MRTEMLRDDDIIMDLDGRLWRVRWVPMEWGETYLHAAPLFGSTKRVDERTALCRAPGHPDWAKFQLLATLNLAA